MSIPWLKGKPHIPDRFWRQYNFFDLYPLDGGSSFVVDEFVGARDDKIISGRIISGELLEQWGSPGDMDWLKTGVTRHTELHAWLHRWSYLVSLGRMYFLNRDETFVEAIFALLHDWERKVGYPQSKSAYLALEQEALDYDYKFQRGLLPSLDTRCPWEWYDLQPGYRTFVLLCLVQLIHDSSTFQQEQQAYYNWLTLHANTIFWSHEESGYKYGNHHTYRMMSLYLAGVLIEHKDAGVWRDVAMQMQTRHLSEDFFADGMYKESLPGYTPFVIMHFRDVLLCAEVNQQRVPATFPGIVLKSTELLKSMVMPNGYLPVINDGPRVKIDAYLELMDHYFPAEASQSQTFHANRACGFPVFKDDHNYLIFDANFAHGTHVQAGKLGFILWHDDEPFIIEAGCCNYDHPEFQPHFRRGWAHSTLLVDDDEDAVWESFWVWKERAHPVITDIGEEASPFVRATSDGFRRFGITHTRTIRQNGEESFTIEDGITNDTGTERKLTFRFILGPGNVRIQGKRVDIRGERSTLTIEASHDSEIVTQDVLSNFFGTMAVTRCVDFVVHAAEDLLQIFTLRFEEASRRSGAVDDIVISDTPRSPHRGCRS